MFHWRNKNISKYNTDTDDTYMTQDILTFSPMAKNVDISFYGFKIPTVLQITNELQYTSLVAISLESTRPK